MQEFLAKKGITVKTLVDAKKERLGSKEALKLAAEVAEIYASKGKKVQHLNLPKDKPDHDTLLRMLLGPSGNLRAPTVRKGKKLLVGFDEAAYAEVLG